MENCPYGARGKHLDRWSALQVRPRERVPLNSYLRQHSTWVDDVLTFSEIITDGALEIPIGQSSEWVTPEATRRLADALATIPRPKGNPRLEAELDNLRKIVTEAIEKPGLALVLTVT